MKRILFYFSSLTPSRMELWSECFEELSEQIGIKISVFFEKESHLQTASTMSLLDKYMIQPEGGGQQPFEYSLDSAASILIKYDMYNLQKFRLQKMTLNQPKVLRSEYRQQLCFVIEQLEGLINSCKPDLVFVMEPKNLDWTANLFILEMICKVQEVDFRFIHVTGSYSRLNIFDNLFRISSAVHETYKRKLDQGLSHTETRRVEQFIASYKKFKSSIFVKDTLQKEPPKRPWWRLGSTNGWVLGRWPQLSRPNPYRYRRPPDLSTTKYILFLPNKPENGRAQYLSPYYSDCNGVLVRSLAISMPLDCVLVIKDHPHTLGKVTRGVLEELAGRFDNCYYIDPRKDSMEIAENAAAVASVASTSALEALMLRKHLILFGETNFNFGAGGPPIKRVTNLENLPRIINECLTEDPPGREILVWVYAILENSFSWALVDDEDWTNNSNQGFEQKWAELVKRCVVDYYSL